MSTLISSDRITRILDNANEVERSHLIQHALIYDINADCMQDCLRRVQEHNRRLIEHLLHAILRRDETIAALRKELETKKSEEKKEDKE